MSGNLSEMFGGSAKAGNLTGLLPPRPRPGAAPPPPPSPEPPEQDEDASKTDLEYTTAEPETATPEPPTSPSRTATAQALVEPAPPRRETKPRTRPATTAGESAARSRPPRRTRREPEVAPLPTVDDTAQVSVYLLPEAKAVAKRLRTDRGILNAEIVFDAIDATRGRLGQLVRAMQYEPRDDDSLFPARSTRRRARTRRQVGQPSRTLWTLQVTPAEHEVLDDLVQVTGANGISQLISAAVEAYLLEESDEGARRT